MPVPQYTPRRSRSAVDRSRRLAASAWAAAASANCDTRSIFTASASLNSGAGFQSTSAPTCTPEPCARLSGRRRMPERPSASAAWNSASDLPRGETTPAPVTATRRAAILDRLNPCRRPRAHPRCAARGRRMSLYALGLNHQTAPLAVRERVVFHVERLREALDEMKRGLAQEAAILSTCNRTELYVSSEQPQAVAA